MHGESQDANIEAYYSHAFAPYWDSQVGIRHDFSESNKPDRNWLAVGIQGQAPYKFNTSANFYLGNAGLTSARLTSDYDFNVTQKLVFWPGFEVNLYGKNDAERNIGKGFANSRLDLRMRYEIYREFAPYFGLQFTNKYGQTAKYARLSGDSTNDVQLIAGLRLWW